MTVYRREPRLRRRGGWPAGAFIAGASVLLGLAATQQAAHGETISARAGQQAIYQGVVDFQAAMHAGGMVGGEHVVASCYPQALLGRLSTTLLRCLAADATGYEIAAGSEHLYHFPVPPYFSKAVFLERTQHNLAIRGFLDPRSAGNVMGRVFVQVNRDLRSIETQRHAR